MTLLCAVVVIITPPLHVHTAPLQQWVQSLKRLPKAMEVPDGLPTYFPAVCCRCLYWRTPLACAKLRHLRLLGVNSAGPWNQTGRERTELVEISAVDWNKCASHWGNLSPLVESASPYPLDVAVETRQDEDGKLCFQLSIGANKNATEGKEARHRFCRRSTHKARHWHRLDSSPGGCYRLNWHATFALPRELDHFVPSIMQRICTKFSSPGYFAQQG